MVLDIHFSLENNWGSPKKTLSPLSHGNPNELFYTLPPAMGTGMIQKISLECGMDLVLLNYNPSGSFVSTIKDHTPVFGFNFSMSGKTAMTLAGRKKGHFLAQGQTSAFFFPEKTGTCQDLANIPVIRISIQMPPRVFHNLLESDIERIPAGLRFPATQRSGSLFEVVDSITPPMKSALSQIINCPYHGTVRRMFLEAKAMEITALKIEQLTCASPCKSRCPVLKSDDLDRVKETQKILADNFQKPPTLLELSRLAGMSRTKLLMVFKKACGITPATYVRNRRLEKARQLLESGRMNVTETAFFVGFSSLSHFAFAFKQYHGILPGHLTPIDQNSILPS